MKKALAILTLLILILSASACRDSELQTVENYEYNASTAAEETTESESDETSTAVKDDNQSYKTDDSWKKNYAVYYRYYNSANDTSTVSVKEFLADDVFIVTYPDAASSIYYKASGANTDMYTISTGEKTHKLLTGKSFSTISSLFMKLSNVEEGFPELSNVMYMGTETVTGRECLKYIQRAYTDGEVTQTVYIWIDKQYGFAAKCQSLNADNTLTLSWEILSFETGEVTAGDADIDISSYDFTEVD